MNNFKIGDLVYTDMTVDVVKVTGLSNISKNIFSGKVVKYLSGKYDTPHMSIGFESNSWWIPVFKKYNSELEFKKIKII